MKAFTAPTGGQGGLTAGTNVNATDGGRGVSA